MNVGLLSSFDRGRQDDRNSWLVAIQSLKPKKVWNISNHGCFIIGSSLAIEVICPNTAIPKGSSELTESGTLGK